MKLSEQMTLDQFYEVADIWYQRSHKIRVIWQDENQPMLKRIKAYFIWMKLYNIVMNCSHIAMEASQPKIKYKKGGWTKNTKT